MNTIVKLSVAGALALGYATAQAQIAQPSSGSSDLILFAEILNSSGTSVVASYAGDTGISINSVLPSSSLNPSGTTVPSTGFTNVSLGSFTVGPDANMTQFLKQDAAGDILEWAVEAGQYTGSASTTNFGPAGNAVFLTTSPSGISGITGKNTGNLTHWGGIDGVVTTINANIAGEASNPTTTSVWATSAASGGVWDATATGSTVANWFGNGPTTYLATPADMLGTSQTLYGVTGNSASGSSTTKVQVYTLGTIQLLSNGTLESVSAVPIPAAVWLLGSGLLGLAGVGRRRATQA